MGPLTCFERTTIKMKTKKTLFVLSITSDIGIHIAKHYWEKGYEIFGTYRNRTSLDFMNKALPDAHFYHCDAQDSASIDKAALEIAQKISKWDIFVSCPCTPIPLSRFQSSDIDEWEKSFYLNSIGQLRFLHRLIPYRAHPTESMQPLVLFLAGGGTNNAVDAFSAYTSAKIHLIKMFELLAFEDQTTKYCIIGPGWTNTKTHYVTLENTDKNSNKYKEVSEFLRNPSNGTPLEDIASCIEWIDKQDPRLVSGRNFSVVHDQWRGQHTDQLLKTLGENHDMYKLRRSGNHINFK